MEQALGQPEDDDLTVNRLTAEADAIFNVDVLGGQALQFEHALQQQQVVA